MSTEVKELSDKDLRVALEKAITEDKLEKVLELTKYAEEHKKTGVLDVKLLQFAIKASLTIGRSKRLTDTSTIHILNHLLGLESMKKIVNEKNEEGLTAAGYFFSETHKYFSYVFDFETEIARSLIKAGAILDWKDEQGNTPISVVAISGKSEFISVVFNATPDDMLNKVIEIPIPAKGTGGYSRLIKGTARFLTPLGVAIAANDESITTNLIKRKGDLNRIDAGGQNALNFALSIGSYKAAEAILKHLPKDERFRMLQIKDGFGMRPIDWIFAVFTDNLNLVVHDEWGRWKEIHDDRVNCINLIANLISDLDDKEKIDFIVGFRIGNQSLLDVCNNEEIMSLLMKINPESRIKLLFEKKESGSSIIDAIIELYKTTPYGSHYRHKSVTESLIMMIKESPEHIKKLYYDKLLDPEFLKVIFSESLEGNKTYLIQFLQLFPENKRVEAFINPSDVFKSPLLTMLEMGGSASLKALNETLKFLGHEPLKSIDEMIGTYDNLGSMGRQFITGERQKALADLAAIFPELSIVKSARALTNSAKNMLDLKKRADEHARSEFLRLAGKRESSIDESLTIAANRHFKDIIKPYLKDQFREFGKDDAERLANIETEIRKTILNAIISNYKNELEIAKKAKKENEEKRIAEILNFIEENREKIVSLDKGVSEKVHEYFNSNIDIAQKAWRCYDRSFPTVKAWPNLFIEPNPEDAHSDLFTTAASTEGRAFDRKIACDTIRERAAYYFLSAIDKNVPDGRKDRVEDFISYVGGIRRAHNDEKNDFATMDNPSCYPGHITRLSLIGSKHPLLAMPDRKTVRSVVEEKVQAIIARAFEDKIKTLPREDKKKLLDALTLFNVDNAQDIIKNPLSSDYSIELFKLRQAFIKSLDMKKIKEEVDKYLREKLDTKLRKEDEIYMNFAVANMGGGKTALQLSDIYNSQIEPTAETPELEEKRQAEQKAEEELKEKELKPEIENPFTIGTMKYFVYNEIFPVLDRNLKIKEKAPNVTEELVFAILATEPESDSKSRIEEAFKALQENEEIGPQLSEIAPMKAEIVRAFESANEKMKATLPKEERKEEKKEKEVKVREEKKEKEFKIPSEEENIRDLASLKQMIVAKHREYDLQVQKSELKYRSESIKGVPITPHFKKLPKDVAEELKRKADERLKRGGPRSPE